MKSITRRNVVAVALRLLSVALLLGAVAIDGFLIVDYASGWISWGSFLALFLFFSVVPVFGAIAAWEAAGRVLAGGQASIQ